MSSDGASPQRRSPSQDFLLSSSDDDDGSSDGVASAGPPTAAGPNTLAGGSRPAGAPPSRDGISGGNGVRAGGAQGITGSAVVGPAAVQAGVAQGAAAAAGDESAGELEIESDEEAALAAVSAVADAVAAGAGAGAGAALPGVPTPASSLQLDAARAAGPPAKPVLEGAAVASGATVVAAPEGLETQNQGTKGGVPASAPDPGKSQVGMRRAPAGPPPRPRRAPKVTPGASLPLGLGAGASGGTQSPDQPAAVRKDGAQLCPNVTWKGIASIRGELGVAASLGSFCVLSADAMNRLLRTKAAGTKVLACACHHSMIGVSAMKLPNFQRQRLRHKMCGAGGAGPPGNVLQAAGGASPVAAAPAAPEPPAEQRHAPPPPAAAGPGACSSGECSAGARAVGAPAQRGMPAEAPLSAAAQPGALAAGSPNVRARSAAAPTDRAEAAPAHGAAGEGLGVQDAQSPGAQGAARPQGAPKLRPRKGDGGSARKGHEPSTADMLNPNNPAYDAAFAAEYAAQVCVLLIMLPRKTNSRIELRLQTCRRYSA